MTGTAPDAQDNRAGAIARYERLREHVLGVAHSADGAPGLTLLMRRGITACISMVDEGTNATTSSSRDVDGLELDDGLRGELARVMVAMALGAASPREMCA